MITVLAKSKLPLISVTIKKTVLEPISEQLKVDLLSILVAIAQLSLDPLSTSFAETLTLPLESRLTVRGFDKTFGFIESIIIVRFNVTILSHPATLMNVSFAELLLLV